MELPETKRTRGGRTMKTIQIVEDGVVLYDVFDELESLKKELEQLKSKESA
jgi:hypothetical protein